MALVPSTRTFHEVSHLAAYFPGLPNVAERYHALCITNDASKPSRGEEAYPCFRSKNPAAMSVNDFLVRTVKYGHCSPQTFVVSIIFLERFLERTGMAVTSHTVHRLLLASFVVAAKLRDDVYYTNTYYASVGGMDTQVINDIERAILTGLSWDISLNEQEYEQVSSAISSNGKVWVQPRSGHRRRATPPMAAAAAARQQRQQAANAATEQRTPSPWSGSAASLRRKHPALPSAQPPGPTRLRSGIKSGVAAPHPPSVLPGRGAAPGRAREGGAFASLRAVDRAKGHSPTATQGGVAQGGCTRLPNMSGGGCAPAKGAVVVPRVHHVRTEMLPQTDDRGHGDMSPWQS